MVDISFLSLLLSAHLRSGLKAKISIFSVSLFSTVFFLCSLDALSPPIIKKHNKVTHSHGTVLLISETELHKVMV